MRALRTILLILTVITMYVLCGLEFYLLVNISSPSEVPGAGTTATYEMVATICNVLPIFVLVLVIFSWIFATIMARKTRAVTKISMLPELTKFLLIPVFLYQLISFVYLMIMGYSFSFLIAFMPWAPIVLGIFGGLAVTLVLTVKLVVTYLMIVPSTAFALAEIMPLCDQLRVKAPVRVLYVILLYLPIIDTISLPIIAGYLSRRLHKQDVQQVLTKVLTRSIADADAGINMTEHELIEID